MMNKKVSAVLRFLLFFGLGVFLIWLSVRNLTQKDIDEITVSLNKANYGWLIAAILIGAISNISRAMRWKQLMEPLGHHPKLSNTFFAVMVGYFANYALPRLGEVSRCGILTKYENVPFAESLGTVIVERIVDVLCLLVVILIVFLIQFDTIWAYLNENFIPGINEKLGNANGLLLIGIAFFVFASGLFVLRKKIFGLMGSKLKKIVTGFADGIKSISKLKSPALFVFHSVFIWVCYYFMLHVSFLSIPETSNLGADAVSTAFILGTIMVAVTPGGIGAYPIAIQGVLLLYAVSGNIGYAVGWLAWLCQFVSNVFFGSLSLILLPVLNKDGNENKS
jgi:glycosyltransferase 2 family protein